jgi:Family of unknown function (DUF5320)
MPGFDRTGPMGQGPGTGWGLGPCGAGRRRGGGQFWGRGFGRGAWGFGRGYFGRGGRWGFGPMAFGPFGYGGAAGPGAPPDEAQALRDEEAYLKNELEAIQKRLSELTTSQP